MGINHVLNKFNLLIRNIYSSFCQLLRIKYTEIRSLNKIIKIKPKIIKSLFDKTFSFNLLDVSFSSS